MYSIMLNLGIKFVPIWQIVFLKILKKKRRYQLLMKYLLNDN